MTKEELKKEAKEKWWDEDTVSGASTPNRIFVTGYLAGAEPREKQIEIDAKQIRALQKQNGELTDKVKELEAEVKEWKDKADLWCKTANLKDNNIMINKELQEELDYQKQARSIAENAVVDLTKENAELKELLKDKSCLDCNHLHSDLKLTKAKELLKRFIALENCTLDYEDIKEAEQFINGDKPREEKEERKYYCKTCRDLMCPYSGTERYEINCSGVEED